VQPAAGPEQRLPGLDAVKAVAIALVVLIHAAPRDPAWYDRCIVGGVARLGVPAFLLVTGFLAGLRAWPRERLAASGLRFLRLHVLYGFFYWAIAIALHGPPERLTWKAALLHFGEASYPGQYDFLVLVQTFFVAGWLLPEGAWRRPGALAASASAAATGLWLLAAAPSLCAQLGLPAWVARPFTTGTAVWLWFYYFALGACLGDRARAGTGALSRLGGRAAAGLFAGATALAAAGGMRAPGPGVAPVDPYARLPIFLGATLVALCLPSLAARRVPRALRRLGADTFGVFVLNPAILSLLGALGGAAAGLAGSWLRAVATVALALPITALLRRRARWCLP
jgi:peptidoglycan/LPS O-acetylase OafA/YrhL